VLVFTGISLMFLDESGYSDLTMQCMAEEKVDSEERVGLRLFCLLLVLVRSIPPLHDAARGFVAAFKHRSLPIFSRNGSRRQHKNILLPN
jgi:hypothetical protein